MSTSIAAVINPNSGGGRTRKRWREIKTKLEAALGSEIAVSLTERPGHAPDLVRQALDAGAQTVLAVGGDGTVNECVNGFLREDGSLYKSGSVFGLVPSGTGGDFRRTFDIPDDLDGAIAHLTSAEPRPIDVGRITFVEDAGSDETIYFANIASFGLSGAVDRQVNGATWSKWFGGGFTYKFESLMAVLNWRDQGVRLTFDNGDVVETDISTVAVANGRYFGAGMMMAPHAEPADGLFDVVIVAGGGKGALLKDTDAIYTGAHLENPLVSVRRARTVVAEPLNTDDHILLDIDGEAPGRLAARFEVLPGALNFRG